jgi:hypothetical protein
VPWSETARRPWVLAQLRAHCGPPAVPPGLTAGAFIAEGLR